MEKRPTAIKGIIFDWGGVLYKSPAYTRDMYIARKLKLDFRSVQSAVAANYPGLGTGRLTIKEFWKRVAREIPNAPSLNFSWAKATRYNFPTIPAMHRLVASLRKKGYTVALLSNTERALVRIYAKKLRKMFDQVFFSCNLGLIKPDPRIYQLALKKLNISPSEAVFIDDKKECTDGAARIGIKTILYKSPRQVKRLLKACGVKF